MIATKPLSLLLALSAAACGGASGRSTPAPGDAPVPSPEPRETSAPAPVILFVGTSLTAGYGLDPADAYPARVQEKLDAAGLRYRVVNAGVSGETSAGARRRIDWLMSQPVSILVVETGANDGLRGLDPRDARANIQAIFDRAKRQTPPPRLMLIGMAAPPNLGTRYARAFAAIYPELAKENGAVLVPFLLEGVAGIPRLNLPDGVHPTPEGHRMMAETVWKYLQPMLKS